MMQTILIEKLRSYMAESNPDILLGLHKDLSVTRYLEDKVNLVMPLADQLIAANKPLYLIEELCLRELTKELLPSRFLYVKSILEEEFLQTYIRFTRIGVLTYEIINLVEACKTVFEKLGFTEENDDDRQLHYAITGTIGEYLEKN